MENEVTKLSVGEKTFAGLLLSFFITLPIVVICAYWPDTISKNGKAYWYKNNAFHVTLITVNPCDVAKVEPPKNNAPNGGVNPSPSLPNADAVDRPASPNPATNSLDLNNADKSKKNVQEKDGKKNPDKMKDKQFASGKIHLNILILLLVAVGGFLGNMIYVAKSFTAFVGAGTFNRNWILWYLVKPFIAAGLAIIIYLAFNNMPEATEVFNLNRIVAIAALTGLFTDIAILKLKDIFEVVIKPAQDTIAKPTSKKMQIYVSDIKPVKIDVNATNQIAIPGKDLEEGKLNIKINDILVKDINVSPDLVKFIYTVEDKTITSFTLVITDNEGNELARKVL